MRSRSTINRRYGWVPDFPDGRDKLVWFRAITLPKVVMLNPMFGPVYDQGQLGSCTANAIAGAIDYERRRQGMPYLYPSRLFVYYNERVIEDSVSTDAGAMIRDGFKTINQQGACAESLWPYDVAQFATQPPAACYSQAMHHETLVYSSVAQDSAQMKTCLAMGFPIVVGFTVYDSFESDAVAASGIVPMPAPTESVLGGHAVCCCGYDDNRQVWLLRNSWGTDWGQKGYFTMPYAYLLDTNLADDFWTVKLEQ